MTGANAIGSPKKRNVVLQGQQRNDHHPWAQVARNALPQRRQHAKILSKPEVLRSAPSFPSFRVLGPSISLLGFHLQSRASHERTTDALSLKNQRIAFRNRLGLNVKHRQAIQFREKPSWASRFCAVGGMGRSGLLRAVSMSSSSLAFSVTSINVLKKVSGSRPGWIGGRMRTLK